MLLVCTGNICRSPMAEGFVRHLLAERGVEDVGVESAGVAGWEGAGATEEAVQALDELGIDISEHHARRLTARMIEAADVIVAMAREHLDAVVRLVPSAADRTFTIKELVRLLRASPGSPQAGSSPAERIRARVEEADAGRDLDREVPAHEDVGDPLGLGLESYRATAWELEHLSASLVAGLLGDDRERSASERRNVEGSPVEEGGAA
jgi:protein-tyrosine phosphatase